MPKKQQEKTAKLSPREPASRATKAPLKKQAAKAASTPAKKRSEKPPISPGAKSDVLLTEGSDAPAFLLPRDGGGTVSLDDYSGRKLVIFFYPRADTPGCTKEAIDFTRLHTAFEKAATSILGVSADPTKAQDAFRNKHQLLTALASDEKLGMLRDYGVWGQKSMYGRTFEGIHRTTVLIGADGKVAKVWRNVKVEGHAEEVLAAAQAI